MLEKLSTCLAALSVVKEQRAALRFISSESQRIVSQRHARSLSFYFLSVVKGRPPHTRQLSPCIFCLVSYLCFKKAGKSDLESWPGLSLVHQGTSKEPTKLLHFLNMPFLLLQHTPSQPQIPAAASHNNHDRVRVPSSARNPVIVRQGEFARKAGCVRRMGVGDDLFLPVGSRCGCRSVGGGAV